MSRTSSGSSSENNGGSTSSNGGNAQGAEEHSPKTGELDVMVGGANAAGLQQDDEGNGLNLVWLFLIGIVAIAAAGAITYVIQKKVDK